MGKRFQTLGRQPASYGHLNPMESTMRSTLRYLLPVAAVLTIANPVSAGPPWISSEFPANPFHADTKGALMLVHAFHHGVARQFPMTGVAEGLVNGRRQTIPLQVERTYREGVYAVRGDLPKNGNWALVITMTDTDTNASANLLATLGADGQVMGVNVPHRMENGWIVPRKATREEIDAAVRNAVALASLSKHAAATNDYGATLAGLGLAGLVLAGAIVRRRKI
jgi:MYXO-CTERM domain-containing protein